MAQTTSGISFVDAYVEYSTDGTAYVDASGFANMVEVSGGDRNSSEIFTADGDEGIVTFGKLTPVEITYTVVYTEGATDVFERMRTEYQEASGGTMRLRWAPAGNASGNYQYTSGTGRITAWSWPGGEVGAGEPMTLVFTLRAGGITKGTI